MSKITPFLWFDTQAEEAANFYVSIFPNSRITGISRVPEGAPGPVGAAMTVSFELDGAQFTALNGGPAHIFTEAVSFTVPCKDQAEVDYYWDKLSDGGKTNVCGWLADKYGLSWQVRPTRLMELLITGDKATAGRVMGAMMQMTKIEIAPLEAAAAAKG